MYHVSLSMFNVSIKLFVHTFLFCPHLFNAKISFTSGQSVYTYQIDLSIEANGVTPIPAPTHIAA